MLRKNIKFLPIQNWPLNVKMTAYFVITVFFVLMLSNSLSYWSLTSSLDKANRLFVIDEVAILSGILQNQPNDLAALRQEVIWNPSRLSQRSDRKLIDYIRILDEQGYVIMATHDMDIILKNANFPRAVTRSELPRRIRKWTAENGDTYLLLTIRTRLGQAGHENRILEIALNVSYQQQILNGYWFRALEFTLLGMLIAAIISHLITQRSLPTLSGTPQTEISLKI